MLYDSEEPLIIKVKLEGRSSWEEWDWALKNALRCINAIDHIDPRGRGHVRGRPLVATPAPESSLTAATGHFPAILQEGTTDSTILKEWDDKDSAGLYALKMSVTYECSYSLIHATSRQSLFQAYWTLYEEYGVVYPTDTFLDLRAFNQFSFNESEPLRPQIDKLNRLHARLTDAGVTLGSNHLAFRYLDAMPASWSDFRGTLIVGITNCADVTATDIRGRLLDYEALKAFAVIDAPRHHDRSKGPRGQGTRRRAS